MESEGIASVMVRGVGGDGLEWCRDGGEIRVKCHKKFRFSRPGNSSKTGTLSGMNRRADRLWGSSVCKRCPVPEVPFLWGVRVVQVWETTGREHFSRGPTVANRCVLRAVRGGSR